MVNWKRFLFILLTLPLWIVPSLVLRAYSHILPKSGHATLTIAPFTELERSNMQSYAELVPHQQEQATLVKTIDTSLFSPPSTDPTGITFLGSTSRLVISDSEVDETVHFSGTNIFVVDLSGSLVDRWSTLAFSEEPTAIIVNPDNGHLFVADDNAVKLAIASAYDGVDQIHPGPEVTEIDPGPDKLYLTEDDVITFIPTQSFGSSDPEGLAYDTEQKHLLVLDDTTHQIYELSPGANGVYEGLVPGADDHVITYDLSYLNMTQIKGLTYNSSNGHLYLVGKPNTHIIETTITGRLVQMIDITAISTVALSDLVFAPSSVDPSKTNLFVTDRGIDNNRDPNENDGKVFEIALPISVSSTNAPPTVDAGSNITIALPINVALLDGTVIDDGNPITPGSLEIRWSQVQGPSNVIFADATQVDTSVTISETGVYVLRLRADDGEMSVSDNVIVTVIPEGTQGNKPPDVAASAIPTTTVGQAITVTGVITDDGLPDPPGVVTSAWALHGDPEGGEIVDPAALMTQITFTQPGEYEVRLTANDGELVAVKALLIKVFEPEPTQAPTRILLPFAKKS
jgi:hypothetical protein